MILSDPQICALLGDPGTALAPATAGGQLAAAKIRAFLDGSDPRLGPLPRVPEAAAPKPSVVMGVLGRAGSLFVDGLFDNHPQLEKVPCALFDPALDHFRRLPANSPPSKAQVARVLVDFGLDLVRLLDPSSWLMRGRGLNRLGPSHDQTLTIDVPHLLALALELLSHSAVRSERDFLVLLHAAYGKLRNRTRPGLFFHCHRHCQYEVMQVASQLNARALIVVRSPIPSLESVIALYVAETERAPMSGLENLNHLHGIMVDMLLHALVPPGRDLAYVRLDDIKRRPTETMQAIASFCGIAMVPELLEPTAEGLHYDGAPSSDGTVVAGFAEASPRRHSAFLTDFERGLLSSAFAPFAVALGFESQPPATSSELCCLDEPLPFERLFCKAPDRLEQALTSPRRRLLARLLVESQRIQRGDRPTPLKPPVNVIQPVDPPAKLDSRSLPPEGSRGS
jgi:hypothetical protein